MTAEDHPTRVDSVSGRILVPVLNLNRLLGGLFDPSGFMPRRICGQWTTELILLHNASDALTSLSYFAIPVILAYLIWRRIDPPFRPIFGLFGAFIFACGLTHVLDIVVFYSPVYRLVGAVKLATGLISAATVVALIRVIPWALALRSRLSLERELEERHCAEEAASIRTARLEALIELSRRSLAAGDADAMAVEAATLAARGLGVEFCGVFLGTPGGAELRLRGGVGWRDGMVGVTRSPAGIGQLVTLVACEAGLALAEPAIEDLATDLDPDAVGGLGIRAEGPGGPHGILVSYMTGPPTLFLVAHAPGRSFGDDEVSFLRSVAGLLGSNLGRIEAERSLTRLATTDGLTGLRNARHLREMLNADSPQACRSADVRSTIMLDIDHFKSYNDSFGHPAGDEVLCQVGAIIRREARAQDLVARFGGEEFALVLPGTGAPEARAFAERLRIAIASYSWPCRPVTASLGLATGGPGGVSGMGLLGEADQALYLAKRTGRDRVVHHDDLKTSGDAGPCAVTAETRPVPPGSIPAGASLLHIDDDADYCRVLARQLGSAGLTVVAAASATEGLLRASEGHDLILLDVRLPDGNGLELCRSLKADPATAMTPVLLLSGTLLHGEDRAKALAAGASAALPKLADPAELLAVISALLRARRSERELIRERLAMGERLREQAAELGRVCDAAIEGWARALELRDHETEGHSRRVAEMTARIARKMGLSEHEVMRLRRGALLHDIGKVGVPDAILRKPGPLDDEERSVLRRHPEVGYGLLRPIEFLRSSLDIPLRHHERWDGGGYPGGLKAEEIPLAARIFAAADIYDALSHDRPYRKAWEPARVREHIRSLAGSHLDPAVVDAILALL